MKGMKNNPEKEPIDLENLKKKVLEMKRKLESLSEEKEKLKSRRRELEADKEKAAKEKERNQKPEKPETPAEKEARLKQELRKIGIDPDAKTSKGKTWFEVHGSRLTERRLLALKMRVARKEVAELIEKQKKSRGKAKQQIEQDLFKAEQKYRKLQAEYVRACAGDAIAKQRRAYREERRFVAERLGVREAMEQKGWFRKFRKVWDFNLADWMGWRPKHWYSKIFASMLSTRGMVSAGMLATAGILGLTGGAAGGVLIARRWVVGGMTGTGIGMALYEISNRFAKTVKTPKMKMKVAKRVFGIFPIKVATELENPDSVSTEEILDSIREFEGKALVYGPKILNDSRYMVLKKEYVERMRKENPEKVKTAAERALEEKVKTMKENCIAIS